MSDMENDNTQIDNTNENDNVTQNSNTQQGSSESTSAWLDSQLDNLEKETRGEAGKATEDQNKDGKGAPQQQQQGNKGNAGEGDGKGNDTQQRGQVSQQDNRFQQAPQKARQYGTHFTTNARGDIVDARGGLVARSGGERAMFHKLFPLIDKSENEAASLRTRLENFENANALAKKEGLTIDEQGAALSLMVNWKKNPVQTIKTMLQLAADRGIDTNEIVQGGGGYNQAAAMQAFEELIEKKLERFAPFLGNLQAQAEESALHSEVLQNYEAFLQQFPDAKTHEQSIANIMRDKEVNEREAYFILRTFAATEGLDWTKDLKPQLEAKQSNGNGQQRGPNGGGNNRQLPNMNGRSGNGDSVKTNSRGYANADDSWDSIAREVLQEHGRQT